LNKRGLKAGVASVTSRVCSGGGDKWGKMGKRVDKEVWRVGKEEEDEEGGGNRSGNVAFEDLGEANTELSSSSTILHAIRRLIIALREGEREQKRALVEIHFSQK